VAVGCRAVGPFADQTGEPSVRVVRPAVRHQRAVRRRAVVEAGAGAAAVRLARPLPQVVVEDAVRNDECEMGI